ncbi:hypothetical protein [Lacticaseibacillus hulanensis]|uniref:hypothetical protein n=1 Tax=Lacticaseibacillus hulanensis TaxID=2493111 RepID=UPI000FDBA29B|nr:hypothetical protein [Lacticaseibacillus hulanensis]
MERYDGPVFRTDDNKSAVPAPKSSAPRPKTSESEPTYHSVDPMSQFVTPPSYAPRRVKPAIDYRKLRARMARDDAAVYLLATDADADVPFADSASTQSVEQAAARPEATESLTAPATKSDAATKRGGRQKQVDGSAATPEIVDAPVVADDILAEAADAEETEHIPATLTELAERGRIQSRQGASTKKKPVGQKRNVQRLLRGGTRPNRLNIHQAYAQFKSSQTGQKGHH